MTPATPGAGRTPAVRPALSRAHIVATALALVDREGLDKLSMRRLGAKLGADPMAVYHYFPSKAALFDGLVGAVYAEIVVPPEEPGLPWRTEMLRFMTALRTALRAHPAVLPAVATRPVNAPAVLPMIEIVVARLVRAGATPGTALDALNCLAVFTIGHALAEVGEPVGGPDAPLNQATDLDLSALPTLARVFGPGYTYDPDLQYELGTTAMLDGLATRLHLTDTP